MVEVRKLRVGIARSPMQDQNDRITAVVSTYGDPLLDAANPNEAALGDAVGRGDGSLDFADSYGVGVLDSKYAVGLGQGDPEAGQAPAENDEYANRSEQQQRHRNSSRPAYPSK